MSDNCLWQQRYMKLKQMLEDMEFDIRNAKLDVAETRAWDAAETIYVSFCDDVCDSEEYALKNFGKGKYDVYKLHIKGDL